MTAEINREAPHADPAGARAPQQEVCTVTAEINRETQVDPITEAEYELIVLATQKARPRGETNKATLRGAVDIAAIGLMRDCLLRPGEAAAARWPHLQREEDGSGRLTIPRSKTHGSGTGNVAYVSPTTIRALDEMCSIKQELGIDSTDDRIFQMGSQQLRRHIRNACESAGLKGRFSGQSPRIGMAMDLARFQVSRVALMTSGRWKSPDMLAYYTRNMADPRP